MPGKPVDVVLRERVEVAYAWIQWSRRLLSPAQEKDSSGRGALDDINDLMAFGLSRRIHFVDQLFDYRYRNS